MNEFADRLNLLFAAFLQPSEERWRRAEWSDSAVARLAEERVPDGGHPALTRQYLGMLRSGKRQPSLRSANAIAVAFAELSRRSGTPMSSGAILNYLAGDHPAADRTDLDPDGLRCALGAYPATDMDGLADLARTEPDATPAGSLEAVRWLIEQLSRQDAAPMRHRLARLLDVGGPAGTSEPDPGR